MIVVERRFCGPPTSGHGGYVAGLLAAHVGNPAEVTLRRPPPLERPLRVEAGADHTVELRDGDAVVAEGRRIDRFEIDVPDPIRWADAEAAADAGRDALRAMAFRTSFACGTQRSRPDGLCLEFGPVPGRNDALHAAPWVPDPSLAGAGDSVAAEFVWAALDCPSVSPVIGSGAAWVLGRIAVDLRGAVAIGYRYIIGAWLVAKDGRKAATASVLFTDMGDVRAIARTTWIEVDEAQFVRGESGNAEERD